LENPQLALARQSALTGAAGKALSGWSGAELALWSTVFVLVIGAVPLGIWVYQRRRRPAIEDPAGQT
jgi:hypothetical protein